MKCQRCGSTQFTTRRDQWGYLTARCAVCHYRVRLGVRYVKPMIRRGVPP